MFIFPIFAGVIAFALVVALFLRRVVPTNEIHIVQTSKSTVSYGKDTGNGNVYYEWPSWLPVIGVTTASMPVSVFDITLAEYPAYDKGRVPFVIDIVGFFRISNSNIAAQRVASFEELESQLKSILQGAVRAILAKSDIEEIMQERSTFGDNFTKEVRNQLSAWGIEPVKNLELMDVRDGKDSKVIANIMEKKKSLIEKQSRIEVANNNRDAEIAEVQAIRESDIKRTEAEQQVQTRVAEKNREVGVANEQAKQKVNEEARTTKEKEMAVVRVHDVQRAEITKDMGIVQAEEAKQKTILSAEATLRSETLRAEGIQKVGEAAASAEKAMQLAPVEAQIVLAQEIGENAGYQTYLIEIRGLERDQAIGIANAAALEKAQIKVIANTGANAGEGLKSIGELFSPNGGLKVGGALEALANTEVGKELVNKFITPKADAAK